MTFGSLASIASVTSITVDSGSKATLSAVASYVFPTTFNFDVAWRASGVGSDLTFPSLATITGPSTSGEYLTIQADASGKVLLPSLTTISKSGAGGNGVLLHARSSGMLSTPALTAFNDNDSNPLSGFLADGGATFSAPLLVAARGASIDLN